MSDERCKSRLEKLRLEHPKAYDDFIEAMKNLQFSGLTATGVMTWNANGEVDKVPTAMIIKNGAYVGKEIDVPPELDV